jgi:hypothetical protein
LPFGSYVVVVTRAAEIDGPRRILPFGADQARVRRAPADTSFLEGAEISIDNSPIVGVRPVQPRRGGQVIVRPALSK